MWQQEKIRNIVFTLDILIIFLVLINIGIKGFYDKIFLVVYTLGLLLVVKFVQRKFNFKLAFMLEILLGILIIMANILGEVYSFYNLISWWDIVIHLFNSFLITFLVFAGLIVVLEKERILNLKPLMMAIFSFAISISIGVFWEVLEYTFDKYLKTDGQKDTIINTVVSLKFDLSRNNKPVKIENVAKTILYDYDDQVITTINGGYLDIGLNDTMSDLLYDGGGSILALGTILIYLRKNGSKAFKEKFGIIVK